MIFSMNKRQVQQNDELKNVCEEYVSNLYMLHRQLSVKTNAYNSFN